MFWWGQKQDKQGTKEQKYCTHQHNNPDMNPPARKDRVTLTYYETFTFTSAVKQHITQVSVRGNVAHHFFLIIISLFPQLKPWSSFFKSLIQLNRKQFHWKPTTIQPITSVNSLNPAGGCRGPVNTDPHVWWEWEGNILYLWRMGTQYIWHSFIGLLFNDFLDKVRLRRNNIFFILVS